MPESARFDYSAFDELLEPAGPVVLAGQQLLKPAAFDTATEIVFPPSYANPSENKDDPPVYNIDVLDPLNPSKNVCVLDSIPSQANRMEPLFANPPYDALVPQFKVKLTNESEPVNILHVGHRLADAVFRGTELRAEIVKTFKAYAAGNAVPLARLGPTSLVFGVWDSRGTGVKVPRLINSIVRAYNVTQLKRSAQYTPPIKYEQEGLIPAGLEGKPADHGLADVPSTHTIGGVQIHGDVRRSFSLNLELLRDLRGGTDEETRKLQRYVLALALLAFIATQQSTLRQGCQLLPRSDPSWKQFNANGMETPWDPRGIDIGQFAIAAANDFGVVQPPNQPLVFNKDLLKASIESDAKKKADKKAESAGDPVEVLRNLVTGLDFKGKEGKKQFKENMSKKNLGLKLAEVAADASAPDELKQLAARVAALLTDETGADVRKAEMLTLFPTASAEPPAAAPPGDVSAPAEDAAL